MSILDFLYLGEANVYQEDFDSFLATAEEIQLKGFTKQQTSKDLVQEHEETQRAEPVEKDRDLLKKSTTASHQDLKCNINAPSSTSTTAEISNQSSNDLQALDEKVKSMMEKGQKMIICGKTARGTPIQNTSSICKVCGKEGIKTSIRNHIESKHLEGICIPCDFCGNIFSSRASLNIHKSRYHIKNKPWTY